MFTGKSNMNTYIVAMVPSCVRFASYYMKKYIIKLIANQYRKRVAVAKYLRVKHIAHMYSYSYAKLIQTYVKSLTL